MINRLFQRFTLVQFSVFSVVTLITVLTGIYTENYLLAAVVPFLLIVYVTVAEFNFIYYTLLAVIPLSIEVSLPGGFGTDLPTEPLMVGLMLVFFGFVFTAPKKFNKDFLKHPLFFFLVLHIAWMCLCVVYSGKLEVSVKYMLAKIWYVTTFCLMTSIVITDYKKFKPAFWGIILTLFFTVIWTLARHSQYGFSFASVNTMMAPFYRNHVNYAALLALMMPFLWAAIFWYKRGTFKNNFLRFLFVLFLVAIGLSYTRGAWLACGACVGAYFLIQRKLFSWFLGFSFAALLLFIGFLIHNNEYLKFAPDYQNTIMHENFEDHLVATTDLEDISSAERVYRWVAAFHMFRQSPWVGYGPGNFYNFYKGFTVNSFRTYVSDNPERSTVHNYFLLMLTEQGIFGLLFFIALTISIFYYGQRIYHQTTEKDEKRFVMAILLCMVAIYVQTFLSDLLEVDKIGSFYFINIALLINQDLRNKNLLKAGHQPGNIINK